jgi:hypothetical protein
LPTIIAVAALISAAYMLTLVDEFIHSTLLSFGLAFSDELANSYWTLLRVTWALLAVCAFAITMNMIFIVRSSPKEKRQSLETAPIRRVLRDTRPILQTKEKNGPISIASDRPVPPKPTPKPMPTTAPEPSYTSPDIPTLFKCSHCGKAFTQPLRMLNFQVDPPRIVNVCPFCNETMPSGSTDKESENDENRTLLRRNNGHVHRPLTQ